MHDPDPFISHDTSLLDTKLETYRQKKNMNTLYSIHATGFQIILPCQSSLQNSPLSHSTSQKIDYREDFFERLSNQATACHHYIIEILMRPSGLRDLVCFPQA